MLDVPIGSRDPELAQEPSLKEAVGRALLGARLVAQLVAHNFVDKMEDQPNQHPPVPIQSISSLIYINKPAKLQLVIVLLSRISDPKKARGQHDLNKTPILASLIGSISMSE